MKVDISGIARVNGASQDIEFIENWSEKSALSGDFVLNSSVAFKGTMTNLNGILKLNGQLKTSYKSVCYRCLEEIEKPLDLNISESFVYDKKGAEELDAYIYENKIIDLEKPMEDNILLNLPMQQLCSNECKGLCQICGINMNKASCSCTTETANPQMKKLEKWRC